MPSLLVNKMSLVNWLMDGPDGRSQCEPCNLMMHGLQFVFESFFFGVSEREILSV